MRISDEMVNSIVMSIVKSDDHLPWTRTETALAADLQDARAEIAQLKKANAELIKCIEDIKK